MSEWFDRIFNSEELDTFAGFALLFGIGLFLYIMNWVILFNNMKPGNKWSSMVPPLGGLLIAVGILLAGGGWWALVGLTDPCIGMVVYTIAISVFGKDTDKDKDKEEKDENGQ